MIRIEESTGRFGMRWQLVKIIESEGLTHLNIDHPNPIYLGKSIPKLESSNLIRTNNPPFTPPQTP